MTQVLLTKETSEIIRLFRNIDSLSKMLDKQEEKITSDSKRRRLHYRA